MTGIGVVSAIGLNRKQFGDSLREGRCGIRPITLVDRDQLQVKNGAEALGFDPTAHFDAKQLAMMDRFSQFAVVAARNTVTAA